MKNQRQSNKQYKPIDGDFYDELEAAATLNQICEITYRGENGQEQNVISRIIDLYTEYGVEYAKLENQIIRLDSIVSINGKTEGGGKVDTEKLQENAIQDDTSQYTAQPGENPLQQHDMLGSPTPGDLHMHQDHTRVAGKDNIYANSTGSVEEGRTENIAGQHTALHQNDSIEDNLLGNAVVKEEVIIVETVTTEPSQHLEGKTDESDFAHQFITSPGPYIIEENQNYILSADRLRNRIYLKVLRVWDDVSDVTELGIYLNKIAPFMAAPFSLLNDLTDLKPDENGTLMSPAIPNKDVLISAGLTKVADLVPYDCETLVHGIYSFSVNSLRLRYFKDRLQAENWLTGDAQIGGDMKEGRASAYN